MQIMCSRMDWLFVVCFLYGFWVFIYYDWNLDGVVHDWQSIFTALWFPPVPQRKRSVSELLWNWTFLPKDLSDVFSRSKKNVRKPQKLKLLFFLVEFYDNFENVNHVWWTPWQLLANAIGANAANLFPVAFEIRLKTYFLSSQMISPKINYFSLKSSINFFFCFHCEFKTTYVVSTMLVSETNQKAPGSRLHLCLVNQM